MKFFSPYTLICALALTKTTLASSFSSSTAAQVSERFGIPGLHEAPDLHWFIKRWSQSGDNNFVMRTLAIDLQDPAIFSVNRAALIKYCIEHGVSENEYDRLIRVLVDIGEYEYVIQEFCKDLDRFTHILSWSDTQFESLFAALKLSPNRAAFYEALNSVQLISPFSVRMYALSILDFDLPKELYVDGLSTKGGMVLDVVLEAVRLFKEKFHYRADVVYEHLLAVLQQYRDVRVAEELRGKVGIRIHDLEIIIKAVKMVKSLRYGYSATMEKLEISDMEWAETSSVGYGVVMLMAAYIKNGILLKIIDSKMSEQQQEQVLNYFLNKAANHDEKKLVRMVLSSYGRLSRARQDFIRKSEDFVNFLIKRLKVTRTEFYPSRVSFLFVEDLSDSQKMMMFDPIKYRYDVDIPTNSDQVKNWFVNFKFSSPDALYEFVHTFYFELTEGGEGPPVVINFDNFVQIALSKELIGALARLNLKFLVDGCDKDENMSKFLIRENIWNMKRFIPVESLEMFITSDIHGERMWRNFDRFCGGQLPEFLRRTFKMHHITAESNYLRYRNALIHVMYGRHREIIESVNNPEFRRLLVKDFPELEATA